MYKFKFYQLIIFFFSSDCDLDTSVENDQHFEKILKKCSLAQFLKKVFEDVNTTGKVNMKVNNWINVSYCVTSKVHHFFRSDQYFEPSLIDKWEHISFDDVNQYLLLCFVLEGV